MRINLFFIFVEIVVLFFSLLILKNIFLKKLKRKVCVLCAAVSLSWIGLLILHYLGRFDNMVVVALLMGGSLVGIFYLVERKVKEEMTLFRLPFFLTLVLIGYSLLDFSAELMRVGLFLVGLWIVFLILYIYRTNSLFKTKVQKMVECCKKW